MKKNWMKWALCLVLAVGMLACTALAAGNDPDVAVNSDTMGAGTITVVDGTLTVKVPADKVVNDEQYAILVVMTDVKAEQDTAASLLDAVKKSTTPYTVGEGTILYIDQAAASATDLTFTGKPKSISNAVVLLGGKVPGSETTVTDARILGVIKAKGVTVTGTATAKGATTGNVTVTIKDGDKTVGTATVATGETYSITGVPAKAGLTVEVSSDIKGATTPATDKYVTRTYTLDATTTTALNVEICPKGDVTGEGTVNVGDYVKVLSQAKNASASILTDYARTCGDVKADQNINVADYVMVLSQAKGLHTLW